MSQITPNIKEIIGRADPIMLKAMDSVALQNRIDKKYVVHVSRLPDILSSVIDNYFVLEIGEHREFSYETIYYDTPDFQFFKDHHNGLNNRIKVRCRQYVETNSSFFEIKRKYQGYRTDKFRKNIDGMNYDLAADDYQEIGNRYKKHVIDQLKISLSNYFHRITLVSKKLTERVTIDFDLKFSHEGKTVVVDNIAVIEVKQGKYDELSPIVQALKKERIYENSISKYVYGLLLIGNGVKYNAFKQVLHKVNKIQNANGVH